MNGNNKKTEHILFPKQKLFENLSSFIKTFPSIDKYYKTNYKLDNLNDIKLMLYINILFERHKNYEKYNFFDKVNLIKTQYNNINLLKTEFMLQENIYGNFKFKKYDMTIGLDLLLIKEIQFEKEKKINQKKNKKPLSAKMNKKNKNMISNQISKIEHNNIGSPNVNKNEQKNQARIIEGLLIWIDELINNQENLGYLNYIKYNKNLIIKRFINVDEAFNFIFNKNESNDKDIKDKIKFNTIFFLISGRLYPDYFQKLKQRINKITFIPICCIFTSINRMNQILTNKDEYKEINTPFYNREGVKITFIDCIKGFENYNLFYKKLSKVNHKITINKDYIGCLTFELIYSKNQLVFPFLVNDIMENRMNILPEKDLISFESFIQNNFKDERILKLIIPLLYIQNLPREIVSKFFIRMYTANTSFYSDINRSLMKKEKIYNTYVKLIYEGLYIGSLKQSNDEILYRGSKMSRYEVINIRKSFEEWKNKKDYNLPSFLLYSRTFLSFTKIKGKIKQFLGKTDDYFYGIIFILKNTKKVPKLYSSNADIEYLSIYPDEREVLFFPYTTFCLKNIYEKEFENQNCIFIELDYLGLYEHIYDEFKKDVNFQNNVINSLNFVGFNYIKEVIENGLFDLNINNENNNTGNQNDKKLIDVINKILMVISYLNENSVTIIFSFMTGEKYQSQCNPNITIDELISFFLVSFNSELKLEELKKNIKFLYQGDLLNNYDKKTIKEKGMSNGSIIVVSDQQNFIEKKYNEEIINLYELFEELIPSEDEFMLNNKMRNMSPIKRKWFLKFKRCEDGNEYTIQISPDKTVREAILCYRKKILDFRDNLSFIFREKVLNPFLRICESGLGNKSVIFVVEIVPKSIQQK